MALVLLRLFIYYYTIAAFLLALVLLIYYYTIAAFLLALVAMQALGADALAVQVGAKRVAAALLVAEDDDTLPSEHRAAGEA